MHGFSPSYLGCPCSAHPTSLRSFDHHASVNQAALRTDHTTLKLAPGQWAFRNDQTPIFYQLRGAGRPWAKIPRPRPDISSAVEHRNRAPSIPRPTATLTVLLRGQPHCDWWDQEGGKDLGIYPNFVQGCQSTSSFTQKPKPALAFGHCV